VKALIQRVTRAAVRVDDAVVSHIGAGLLVLLGVARDDPPEASARLADRVAGVRIFPGEDGRFDRSLLDVGGEALVVSQFTLLADASRGRRPSFTAAAPGEEAEAGYEAFCEALCNAGVRRVATGIFGAKMTVELVNDGPVTILLET
jgi:D-tyrosyl-tRNA(Tyr) deacylase